MFSSLDSHNIFTYFLISTSQGSSNILVKHFITMSFNLSTKCIYKISCFTNLIKMVKKIGCQMKEKNKKTITIFLLWFSNSNENTNMWLNTYISYMVYSHILLKLMHGCHYFCKSLSMITNFVTKIVPWKAITSWRSYEFRVKFGIKDVLVYSRMKLMASV